MLLRLRSRALGLLDLSDAGAALFSRSEPSETAQVGLELSNQVEPEQSLDCVSQLLAVLVVCQRLDLLTVEKEEAGKPRRKQRVEKVLAACIAEIVDLIAVDADGQCLSNSPSRRPAPAPSSEIVAAVSAVNVLEKQGDLSF